MKYQLDIPRRKSLRLNNYDYSQPGAYFVTICTNNRECILCEISGGENNYTPISEMVEKWWIKISEKFPNMEHDEFILMPNHIHGIIVIAGADLCVCPNKTKEGEHMGSPLHKVIQWFKTMTTNEYIRNVKMNNWPPFQGKIWQRNYYEHIVRNKSELYKIREYIINNPINWYKDPENPLL
ncbi:hypothetical protein ISS30_06590 [bacterium]|nr:hypothetical protein [bacterium]